MKGLLLSILLTCSSLLNAFNVYSQTISGTIAGPSDVCGGNTVQYTVSGSSALSGYTWTLSSNATILSGQGSKTINVSFSTGQGNGVIYVSGNGLTATRTNIHITTPASAPAAITGPSIVCKGSTATYTTSPGATSDMSFTWYASDESSITSQTSSSAVVTFPNRNNLTSTTINFFTVNGVCGPSPMVSKTMTYMIPEASLTMSNNGILCPGGSVTLTTVPGDMHVYDFFKDKQYVGSSSNGIYSATLAGSYMVVVSSASCSKESNPVVVTALTSVPAALTISGTSQICRPGDQGIVYSVPGNVDIVPTSYVWSVPAGATIASGQNSNTITVNYSSSFISGTIGVYGTNCVGNGPSSNLAVTPQTLPLAAAAISGSQTPCPGDNGVVYSLPAIPNAEGYVWSVPNGATITTGQNTSSITVNYSTSVIAGNVSVYGTNCKGNGSASTLMVTPQPLAAPASAIMGRAVVCPGETGIVYSVEPISNATGYSWAVPSGTTIVSGANTNRIVVNFSSAASIGNVYVAGTRCAITSSGSFLQVAPQGTLAGDPVNHSVDLVTGTLNASIPLFSVQDGDVQVPGALMYSGSGVRITDDDGWLGHNWNLSVQSYGVFRQMRNLPDDYFGLNTTTPPSTDNRRGWLFGTARGTIKTFDPELGSDHDLSTCADEASKYATLDNISYDQDTEPDVFHVAVPGLSFDFYFDENRMPQVVPLKDVVIIPNTPSGPLTSSTTKGPITSFTVTDAKGVRYDFTEMESVTENIYNVDAYYFVRKSNQHHIPFTYTSCWRLTKITSPVYGTINISYSTITSTATDITPPVAWDKVSFDLKYNYRYPLVTSNPYGAGSTLSYKRSAVYKLPAIITSSTSQVEFISAPKYTGSLMQRLNTIKISDKRDGTLKLIQEINFSFNNATAERAFLTGVSKRIGCTELRYGMVYNGYSFPWYGTADKDEWYFYKVNSGDPGALQYDETAPQGSLIRVTHPLKGFTAFFYETHDYWDAGLGKTAQGGGIRVRKILSYDGVSTGNDIMQEFEYKTENGNSSGKLQHKAALSFSVAHLNYSAAGYPFGVRYLEYRQHDTMSPIAKVNEMFTLKGDQDMSFTSSLNGSVVAYERVTVKTNQAGQSVYEYDLPASAGETTANNSEWTASKVLIARPATGTSLCYDTPNLQEGYYTYPFPVNSNYDFAQGLLKKVTNYNESGTKVSDAVYEYQRVYGAGNTGITKIYGLALEKLPTYYYYNGAFVDNMMYVYSRYALFTNVKTEMSKRTETVYNNPSDLTQKSQVITSYAYDSPKHAELTSMFIQNSDGTQSKQKFTYVKDYSITTPNGISSTALANLNAAHRSAVVETVSSKLFIGATEKIISAGLTTYQTLGGKVYPAKQYSYTWGNGAATFTPASINGGGTFQYDRSNYVVNKTFLGFDDYGNATEMADRSRNVSGVAYGYLGTLPIINVANAGISEIRYSDFETPTAADFYMTWSQPAYGVGRNNSRGLMVPAGGQFVNVVNTRNTRNYILSLWVKSATAGNLSVYVGTSVHATYTYSYAASSGYTYYSFTVPVASVIGASTSFEMILSSSSDIQVDDMAFYPEQADFVTSTYVIPNGKTSDTDSKGSSYFYENDAWGRPNAVYDRDRNVIKKYDYTVRP